MKLKNFTFLLLLGLASCGEKLDDLELQIINQQIPEDLFEEHAKDMAESLDDFIFQGLQEYVDLNKSKTKKAIKEYKQSTSIFHDWDPSTIFGGPTKDERLLNQYNSYLNFANRNREKIYNTILGVAEVLANNRSLLSEFPGDSDNVDFSCFNSVGYVPTSIRLEEYQKYYDISFNPNDAISWGEAVLPFSKNPSVRYGALTVAVIKMMQHIPFPKPVYAVYNKENKVWNVGYDTEQAFFVTFIIDNDVENWDLTETNYVPAYIDSKGNVLKK